jgi:hypothetical protein
VGPAGDPTRPQIGPPPPRRRRRGSEAGGPVRRRHASANRPTLHPGTGSEAAGPIRRHHPSANRPTPSTQAPARLGGRWAHPATPPVRKQAHPLHAGAGAARRPAGPSGDPTRPQTGPPPTQTPARLGGRWAHPATTRVRKQAHPLHPGTDSEAAGPVRRHHPSANRPTLHPGARSRARAPHAPAPTHPRRAPRRMRTPFASGVPRCYAPALRQPSSRATSGARSGGTTCEPRRSATRRGESGHPACSAVIRREPVSSPRRPLDEDQDPPCRTRIP